MIEIAVTSQMIGIAITAQVIVKLTFAGTEGGFTPLVLHYFYFFKFYNFLIFLTVMVIGALKHLQLIIMFKYWLLEIINVLAEVRRSATLSFLSATHKLS